MASPNAASEPEAAEQADWRSLARAWGWLALPLAIGLAILIGWLVPTGDFLILPGEAVNTASMVSVPSAPPKPGAGKLYLMTVYSAPANFDEWVFGHVYPHAQLLPARTQLPPHTSYQRFQHLEQAMMTDSQTTAKVVALRQLGYSVPEHGQGVVADSVKAGSAAQKAGLHKGDLILALNGQAVGTNQDLVRLIGEAQPGDQARMTIKPNNSDAKRSITATLGARPGHPSMPFLGVAAITYHPSFAFPVQISINSRGIIGPSGGLILSLSIMQALSKTDLTHGHNIAATGTIDMNGNVGAIGDVRDKVLAAEGHAQYFLVPKSDFPAAKAQATNIKVVEIDTVRQAQAFLAGLG